MNYGRRALYQAARGVLVGDLARYSLASEPFRHRIHDYAAVDLYACRPQSKGAQMNHHSRTFRLSTTNPRKRLERACLNCEKLESRWLLATASIEFSAEEGLLFISGSEARDTAVVSVEDGMVAVSLQSQGSTTETEFEEQSVVSIYFHGSGGDDRFENLTSISSVAIGGPGDDRLLGGSGADRLFGDGGMDYLRGGDGDDKLTGGDSDDIVVGDAGNDRVEGGTRRDVLIGGDGEDFLIGGGWGDIMIGGTTSYDGSSSKLYRIRNLWRSDAAYEDRLANITSSDSFPLAVQETVHDDGAADYLEGESGSDWFFVPGEFDHQQDADYVTFLSSVDKLGQVESDETVSSTIPHADDTSKRNEHFALLGLVSEHNVTSTAVASGGWSDPGTWLSGQIPQDNDNVLIPQGLAVEVDQQVDQRIGNVRVDGTLSFSTTVDSELMLDTLIVRPEGKLEMGTVDEPIASEAAARLLIVDNGAIDRTWDPLELSRGVIVHGTAQIHGAEKTPFVELARLARRGDRTLILADTPSNWRAGDRIVLAGTDRFGKQNEERQIESVDGNRITLDSPLRYNHVGPRDDLLPHVANLTRNAIIESENVEDVRAHLMFMHSNAVDVRYVGIHNLGRTDKSVPANDTEIDDAFQVMPGTGTNQRGRYAAHFHRAGSHHGGHAAEVHGSVVTGSRGWGFVNHSSSVNFTSNVAYDVTGAAFVTETGDEVGRFDGNLAIFSSGSGESTESRKDIEDFGHQGNGFWFQGGGVSVVNNIAAGHDEDGFIFFTRALREGGEDRVRFATENLVDKSIAKGKDSVSVGEVPLREFRNNESYANETGLATRFHKLGNTHDEVSVIEGLQLWNNRRGLNVPYTNRVIVRDVEVIGTPDDPEGWGITRNTVTRNITYENLTVEGYEYGLAVPLRGENTIVSGRFNNIENIVIDTPVRDRIVNIHEAVTFETPDQLGDKTPRDIVMRAEFYARGESFEHVFYSDEIYLHDTKGPRRVYYHEQAASFVPFPEPAEFVADELVGKTNQQLQDELGKSIGGSISSPNSVVVDSIFGLLSPVNGDSNGDGHFNSADLVLIFQAGEYEDEEDGNSTWAEGDWNGDGDVTSADLVLALQGGRYGL